MFMFCLVDYQPYQVVYFSILTTVQLTCLCVVFLCRKASPLTLREQDLAK